MTNTTSKRTLRIRLALAAFVGVPLLLATSAFAQDPNAAAPANPAPAGGEATAAGVVVTGSNIPTAEEVTASPVDTLTSQDIARSGGGGDVLNVLQKRNPDFVGGANIGSSNANVASGATQGGSIVSIRGLPTLVLYEGRRIADSAAISAGGFQFGDVSLFPTSLISRIEVLKDGASAIYGSDAVGGVVNIFLKRDYTGAEAGVRYGFTLESGVAERRAYVIAGVGNDTTHVTAGFQYREIDPLFQRERAYSRVPGGVTTTYGGVGRDRNSRYLLDPTLNSPFDAGVTSGSVAVGTQPYYQNPALMGTYNPASFGTITSFDLSTLPTVTQAQRGTSVNASFTHDIFGKQLELFGDFLYSHNVSWVQLNAQPLSNGTGVVILGSFRIDPITGAVVAENRGAPAQFNPFQLSIDGNTLAPPANRLTIANRYQDHPRGITEDANFYRLLGGIRSQITKDWSAEVAGYYSLSQILETTDNLVNKTQLNAAIAGTALDANGNLLPSFDFFARNPVGTNPGQLTLDQFGTLFGSNIRKQSSSQQVFDGKANGSLFRLPAGPLQVAFGGEYRIEGFALRDSPEIFVGSVPTKNIEVTRGIYSFYGELAVPIIGSQMNVPGIYSLDLDFAGRYDHYEGVSEDAKVPKLSLRYQPIKDLTIRATYSNSFVAPNLFQLYGPTGSGFSTGITFNGVAQDQAQVMSGSNPNLIPATADAYNFGFVYSPSAVPGLTVSVDYFHTLYQKIVGTLGGGLILNSVNNLGPASPYYGLVSFNNFPGQAGAQPVGGPGSLAGNLAATYYLDVNQNLGAARVEGFDLSAHYDIDLHNLGNLELGVQSVVFTQQDLKTLPTDHYYNISNLVGAEGFGSNPDFKVTGLIEYRIQGFTIGFNANYTPSLLNAVGNDPQHDDQSTYTRTDDYITVDGRVSYEFKRNLSPTAPPPVDTKDSKNVAGAKGVIGSPAAVSPFDRLLDGLALTVGCNNIGDMQPPYIAGGNSATSLESYDPYGRFLYFEVRKKF